MNTDTRLNEHELEDAWARYELDDQSEAKNQLLTHYVYLVKGIVRRVAPKYNSFNDYDDLVSCGVLGLLDAVEKFDSKRGIKFETYASTRVRGEILDYMRNQDWAPSSLRRKINQVNEAYNQLELKLGRNPSDQEVARELGMPVEKLQKVTNKAHTFNLMYFEDLLAETQSPMDIRSWDQNPAEQIENNELIEILREMIDELPDKERLVVSLYYYEELTLREIAQIIKVTESRVCQIHSRILSKLNKRLKKTMSD